jgi:hypothetical protein
LNQALLTLGGEPLVCGKFLVPLGLLGLARWVKRFVQVSKSLKKDGIHQLGRDSEEGIPL